MSDVRGQITGSLLKTAPDANIVAMAHVACMQLGTMSPSQVEDVMMSHGHADVFPPADAVAVIFYAARDLCPTHADAVSGWSAESTPQAIGTDTTVPAPTTSPTTSAPPAPLLTTLPPVATTTPSTLPLPPPVQHFGAPGVLLIEWDSPFNVSSNINTCAAMAQLYKFTISPSTSTVPTEINLIGGQPLTQSDPSTGDHSFSCTWSYHVTTTVAPSYTLDLFQRQSANGGPVLESASFDEAERLSQRYLPQITHTVMQCPSCGASF
jgi:hypothetical protein